MLGIDLGAVDEWIDFGEGLALLHDGIEINEHLRHAPIDLRADINLQKRLHRPRGLNLLDDVANADRCHDVARRRRRSVLCGPGQAGGDHEGTGHGVHQSAEPAPPPLLCSQSFLQLFGDSRCIVHVRAVAG